MSRSFGALLLNVNCRRARTHRLFDRFDKQFGADRRPFGFDRTDVEPHGVAMARRQIKHFARSNKHSERGGAFDNLIGFEVGGKMNPEVHSVACGSHYKAWELAAC